MAEWFGASWSTIGFVVASTVAMYATLLVAVRVAGRRTVAQLSAFDVIVTVALGTLLSSTILTPDPGYAQATTAVVTLLVLQLVVAALRVRVTALQRLLEFEPEVVVRRGRVILPTKLTSSQLSEGELHSRLREQGVFEDEQLAVVVLEPTGGFSVARHEPEGPSLIPDDDDADRQ